MSLCQEHHAPVPRSNMHVCRVCALDAVRLQCRGSELRHRVGRIGGGRRQSGDWSKTRQAGAGRTRTPTLSSSNSSEQSRQLEVDQISTTPDLAWGALEVPTVSPRRATSAPSGIASTLRRGRSRARRQANVLPGASRTLSKPVRRRSTCHRSYASQTTIGVHARCIMLQRRASAESRDDPARSRKILRVMKDPRPSRRGVASSFAMSPWGSAGSFKDHRWRVQIRCINMPCYWSAA